MVNKKLQNNIHFQAIYRRITSKHNFLASSSYHVYYKDSSAKLILP